MRCPSRLRACKRRTRGLAHAYLAVVLGLAELAF
jgi:hypothetical protein